MIKFKDLSVPCKIGVIGGWATVVIYSLSFLVGFLGGLLI
jgi:hypothetical protein